MDTELIGWRTKENEVSPHYYCKDDTGSGADAISLCEKFYASRNELVFPGPGMAFCSECGEIASKIASEYETGFLKSVKEMQEFIEANETPSAQR